MINILYEKVQIENKKTIQLKKITEWKIKNTKIQKGVRFGFSSRPKENRLLVNRSDRLDGKQKLPEYRVSELIDIVKQIVIHQRIKINGKLLKFVKGLAQGSAGKLSVLLCDIYYGFMDELYFKEINNCEKSILIRVVDDYLLITSVFERAELFFKIVQCGVRDFNARFNLDKLTSNLVDDIREVTYLGLVFNFEDMSVTPDYSKYEKNNFLTMMKLSDNLENMHFDKDYFFGKKILSLSALKLQTIVLNDMYNNVEAIRKIILQASVFQSIRAMTLANYLYPKGRKNELAVSKIVLKFGDRITKIASSQSGISEKEITWLFLTAVVATFKRRSGQFKTLLLIMRYKLQKCEKGFLGHEKTILSYFKKFFNNEVNLILNAFLGSKLTEKAFK